MSVERWTCLCGEENPSGLPVCKRCERPSSSETPDDDPPTLQKEELPPASGWMGPVVLLTAAAIAGVLFIVAAIAVAKWLHAPAAQGAAEPAIATLQVQWESTGPGVSSGWLVNKTNKTFPGVRLEVVEPPAQAPGGFVSNTRGRSAAATFGAVAGEAPSSNNGFQGNTEVSLPLPEVNLAPHSSVQFTVPLGPLTFPVVLQVVDRSLHRMPVISQIPPPDPDSGYQPSNN